jgi:hypothetical protein
MIGAQESNEDRGVSEVYSTRQAVLQGSPGHQSQSDPVEHDLTILLESFFELTSSFNLNLLHKINNHTAVNMGGDTSHNDKSVWSEGPPSPSVEYVHINLRRNPSQAPETLEQRVGAMETHEFPAKLPDWSNINVLHVNTLPPRASFFVYDNVKDALTRDVSKSKTHCLSGIWKFNLAKGPFDAQEGFQHPKFDASGWDDIKVPGMWQLQGHGKGPQ